MWRLFPCFFTLITKAPAPQRMQALSGLTPPIAANKWHIIHLQALQVSVPAPVPVQVYDQQLP